MIVPLVIFGMSLTSCVVAQPAQPTTASTDEQTGSTKKPLLSRQGMLTSNDLFDVFISTCLTTYPDSEATKRAMNRTGLRTVEYSEPKYSTDYPSGSFEDSRRLIEGQFGPILYELEPGLSGATLPSQYCAVYSEVTDLDANWAPLMKTIPARISGANWQSTDRLAISFKRGKETLSVRVTPPSLGFVYDDANPLCVENGCSAWMQAELELYVSTEG